MSDIPPTQNHSIRLFLRFQSEQEPHHTVRLNEKHVENNAGDQREQADGPELGRDAPTQLTDIKSYHDNHSLMKNVEWIEPFIKTRKQVMRTIEVMLAIGYHCNKRRPGYHDSNDIKPDVKRMVTCRQVIEPSKMKIDDIQDYHEKRSRREQVFSIQSDRLPQSLI